MMAGTVAVVVLGSGTPNPDPDRAASHVIVHGARLGARVSGGGSKQYGSWVTDP